MNVLFQKPGCATATFKVSPLVAVVVTIKPASKASVLFIVRSAPATRRSILSDVLLAHHAAPAREFVCQQLAEVGARSRRGNGAGLHELLAHVRRVEGGDHGIVQLRNHRGDRKSTRLNSSHSQISYAVFCL